jgi:hypothetical protein
MISQQPRIVEQAGGVPPLVQGFEARPDRAGPRAQRWLMWPNTKQRDQNGPFRGAIKETQTVHRVTA